MQFHITIYFLTVCFSFILHYIYFITLAILYGISLSFLYVFDKYYISQATKLTVQITASATNHILILVSPNQRIDVQ